MDISLEVIPNAMFGLSALTMPDLEQWTIAEIYEWADEAEKDLAQQHGLFTQLAPAYAYTANQFLIPVPADHLATVRVEANGVVLKPTNVVEVQAYDDDWDETKGPAPLRWIGDSLRTGFIVLYPQPTQPGVVIFAYQGDGVTLGLTVTIEPQLNVLLGDALALSIIAQARALETDAQMPDAAAYALELLSIYDAACKQYYSGGM